MHVPEKTRSKMPLLNSICLTGLFLALEANLGLTSAIFLYLVEFLIT